MKACVLSIAGDLRYEDAPDPLRDREKYCSRSKRVVNAIRIFSAYGIKKLIHF